MVTSMMKGKIPILIFLIFSSIACSKEDYPTAENVVRNGTGKIFYADFKKPDTDNTTKVGVDSFLEKYWHSGDRIAVFESASKLVYAFDGQTGDKEGTFSPCEDVILDNKLDTEGQPFSKVYSIYPNESGDSEVSCVSEGLFEVSIPQDQNYSEGSFDAKADFMVAVTKALDDNNLHFYNACGYFRLKLYGGDKIRRITLRGNADEVISGKAQISLTDDNKPVLEMTGDGTTITLDCGETGVQLPEKEEKALIFWFVVPPVDFENGITVTIENTFGQIKEKSTPAQVRISRNKVETVRAFEIGMSANAKFLEYSLLDSEGNEFPSYDCAGSNITVIVPKGTDLTSLKPVFKIEGASVSIDGVEQESGKNILNFTDFLNPVDYKISNCIGDVINTVSVRAIDTNLPAVFVSTDNHRPINNKVDWIGGRFFILQPDGTIEYDKSLQIRGRGNYSWSSTDKKPYNIKLESKTDVLGMPKHKRWRLMAGWFGFLNNPLFLEVGRRCSIGWSPRGEFVELVLNGEFRGMYWLAEHLSIDKNRLNIAEMTDTDLDEPEVTGGYLLEYGSADSPPSFSTGKYGFTVMVSSLNENSPKQQVDYIKNYVNDFESSLKDEARLAAGEFKNFIDINSFSDFFFVMELAQRHDFTWPRSVFIHKDRNGKLQFGPLWDFDYSSSNKSKWYYTNALYYKELLNNPDFLSAVKSRWPEFKSAQDGVADYIDQLYARVNYSAERDYNLWKNVPSSVSRTTYFKNFSAEYTNIKNCYLNNLKWIDNHISTLETTK